MFRPRTRAASAMAAFAVFTVLTLAGCAPATSPGVATVDDDPSATNAPTDDDANPDGDPVKFAECMREHGIEMPDPEPDQGGFGIAIPDGGSPDDVDAAMEACEEFMPGSNEVIQMSPEQLAQMREFSKCMRENGIENFPDPGAEGGLTITSDANDPNSIDPMSQEFRDAEKKCEKFQPKPPKGEEERGLSPRTERDAS